MTLEGWVERTEAPTWTLALGVYTAWGALTWGYHSLPWWLLLPAGAYVTCLHGSLQHEVLHGHPTRRRWLNELLARPALWLWLPYGAYRDSHLAHHRTTKLTCPGLDPESNYLVPEDWARLPAPVKAVYAICATSPGRLIVGPAVCVAVYLGRELRALAAADPAADSNVRRADQRALARGNRRPLRHWPAHAAFMVPVLYWVLVVCEVPFWGYVGFFAYPGLALTLLRSFAEHRPERDQGRATAIVEASWPMALVYLNNNLHAVHHERPDLPWYRLPSVYRAERAAILARNGGHVYPGYAAIIGRF
ncbi:MAG: fatty acid desaturase, partial [Alphaproteobacteria bacterium]|nr:fatty acid desaturase [Alphaproteobacteria bacterium]